MYFDAVLDENMVPLFNGTPEATKEWLEANDAEHYDTKLTVCIGKTMRIVAVHEYLNSK